MILVDCSTVVFVMAALLTASTRDSDISTVR